LWPREWDEVNAYARGLATVDHGIEHVDASELPEIARVVDEERALDLVDVCQFPRVVQDLADRAYDLRMGELASVGHSAGRDAEVLDFDRAVIAHGDLRLDLPRHVAPFADRGIDDRAEDGCEEPRAHEALFGDLDVPVLLRNALRAADLRHEGEHGGA